MILSEAYEIAINNVKGRKKVGKMISIMFFLAMFILLLINSMAKSFDDLVEFVKEIPVSRYVIITDNEELPENYLEVIKDMNHVTEVTSYAEVFANVEGFSGHGKKSMDVVTSMDMYREYIVKGKMPKKGEVLIPEYMNASTGGYYDAGSDYIGKEIRLYVENQNKEKEIYEFTVSGTYDNIYATMGAENLYVTDEDANNMYRYSKIGWENKLAEDMEANNDYDPLNYVGYEPKEKYAFAIDEYKNVKNVLEKLSDELKIDVGQYTSQKINANENEIQKLFDIVQFIMVILVMILMVVVIIMMVVTVGNDIRGRKKEMAMYLVQGYTRKELITVLTLEYAVRLVPVLLVSTISTVVLLILGDLAIANLLSAEYQILNMSLDLGTFFICVVVLLIVLGTAAYNITEQLRNISLLKEIKSEG